MGNIVWLASYPKSGNTWLRAFLANLVADAGAPLPLADLPQYCQDEARPELFTALAGRPSSELTFDEVRDADARVVVAPRRELGGSRGRIERAVASASFETLASLERSEGFAEASDKSARFFREGRAGQWREVLTPAQVARIEARHRTQMERFGYAVR